MAGVWAPPASPKIGIEVTIFGASTNDTTQSSSIAAASATATATASIELASDTASINSTSSVIGLAITASFANIALLLVLFIWFYRHTHLGKVPNMRDAP